MTQDGEYGILILANIRRCGGMVDTGDLKSPGSNTVPVRVRSPAPLPVPIPYRGVEQLVARRAHNPEVAGSSPASATISSVHNGFDVMNTRFFMLLFESRHFAYSPSLCGDIFHGHALPCFGDIMGLVRGAAGMSMYPTKR